MIGCACLFPSRFHDRPHVSPRQYARLVHDRVAAIGLEPSGYGTPASRRIKATQIYRKTGNLSAVRFCSAIRRSTARSGICVELEDALSIAEAVDI